LHFFRSKERRREGVRRKMQEERSKGVRREGVSRVHNGVNEKINKERRVISLLLLSLLLILLKKFTYSFSPYSFTP
jgi:hypothetical protein